VQWLSSTGRKQLIFSPCLHRHHSESDDVAKVANKNETPKNSLHFFGDNLAVSTKSITFAAAKSTSASLKELTSSILRLWRNW
jgi:hypothetical protein